MTRLFSITKSKDYFESITKTLAVIKEQCGLNLKLDADFEGVQFLRNKSYFNVVIKERISESNEFIKLIQFERKYTFIS